MIDIHSHIIPAIDDGVQTVEESLELIVKEVEGGTTGFVATPHVYNDVELAESGQIPERLEKLREAVQAAGVQVQLIAGAEVYPSMGILPALDAGRPITTGNHRKHMLVDLPMSNLPMDLGQILFEIHSRGVTPILAHPERVGSIQHNPNLLREYLDRGVVCQVNAGSLYGRYGPMAAECAMYILERHWAHFLASDAHKPRPTPILKRGVEALQERLDPNYLKIITETSGRCVFEGRDLPLLPPAPEPKQKKAGLLGRLFGGKR
jgi:protein-tyrosine phosphatase